MIEMRAFSFTTHTFSQIEFSWVKNWKIERNNLTAIVGEGEHNTLVTMICQLLGPHLKTIDSDTEDIEAKLPV